jgi:poly-D-alanine transfer protein DltD
VFQEFPAVSVISKEEINYTSGAAQTAGTNRSVPSNLSLYNSIKSTKNNSHKKASTLLRNTGGNIIKNYVQSVLQMVSVYEHSKEGFCNVHLVGQKNIVTVLNLNSSNLLVIITELVTSTNTQFDYESMLQVELDKIKNAM